MNFLYPGFLWALLALAIPIIVHLFYFRRFRKVYFTNVRFLKEVKEETSSRTKLKHLLVLLTRLLALFFLVLAFTQPFIPKKENKIKKGAKAVSLFVDNSFSMSALSRDVPLIEKAKQKARDIINAYSVDDEFQILTHDFERRHQRLISKEDALNQVEEITITPSVQDLDKVRARQKQALNTSKLNDKQAYLLSDFQKNITSFDPDDFKDTTIQTTLIPLQSVQQRNLAIDSAWFEAPVQMLNQTNTMIARVTNLSDEDAPDVRLSLQIDGQVRPEGILNIPAGQSAFDTINLTILKTGWHEARLQITDYPIQFDDSYLIAFEVAESIQVLELFDNRPNPFVEAVFQRDDYFTHDKQASSQIDYSRFRDYELILLNELRNVPSGLAGELKAYVASGGNLLIFPSASADLNTYNNLLKQLNANELISFDKTARDVSYVNTQEFIFADVFENSAANLKLPSTTANFKFTRYGNRGEEVILRYRDGNSFLGKYQLDKGAIYLCAAPLDVEYSQLVRNGEIFVPLLYKSALASNKGRKIAYTIGVDQYLETETRRNDSEIVYKLKGSSEEFIPEQRNIGPRTVLGLNDQIKKADYYSLFLEEEEILENFAFNYNRKESELDYFSESELDAQVSGSFEVLQSAVEANLTELIDQRSRGIVLWKWCIWLCLLFLLMEVMILRFWRTR